MRDAELVDVVPEKTPPPPPPRPVAPTSNLTKEIKNASCGAPSTVASSSIAPSTAAHSSSSHTPATTGSEVGSPSSSYKRKSWFRKEGRERANSGASASTETRLSRAAASEDDVVPPVVRLKNPEADWGLGDDVSMELG